KDRALTRPLTDERPPSGSLLSPSQTTAPLAADLFREPSAGAYTARAVAADDARAIASALTLCAFLLALKIVLLIWYPLVKGIHPLQDAPPDGILYIGGCDLLLAAALAIAYRAFYRVVRRHNRIKTISTLA